MSDRYFPDYTGSAVISITHYSVVISMITPTNPPPPVVPKKPRQGVSVLPPNSPLNLPPKNSPSVTGINYTELDTLPDVVAQMTEHTKRSAPTSLSNTTPRHKPTPTHSAAAKKPNFPPTDALYSKEEDSHKAYLDSDNHQLISAAAPRTLISCPSLEDRRSSLRKVEVNDFAPPEPNFGKTLMSRPGIEVVSRMIDEELVYLKSWKRYLEDRTKIEQTYYKALLDLHEKNSIQSPVSTPEIKRETFSTFPSFIDNSQEYVDSLGQSLAKLNKDTIPSLKSLINSKKSIKELYTYQSNKLDKEKHCYTRKMEETRRMYSDLHKEVDTAKINYNNSLTRATKNRDRTKKLFLNKSHDMVEAHNGYVLALKACDLYEQWHHESLLPMFLNTFQRILMLQTDYYSSFYDNLVSTLHGQLDSNSVLLQQLMTAGTALNGDVEYQKVIREKGGQPIKRSPLQYDKTLPKHSFIDLLEGQLLIQNREVTCKLQAELQAAYDEHQKNKQNKHTELTYMDKAITSTQGGHKPLSGYPFDINELCANFANIMLEMQMECYKQDICQVQLRLVERAMGATDGVDLDDTELLERAFPDKPQQTKTIAPGASIELSKTPIRRRMSLTETREKSSTPVQRPVTPPEPASQCRMDVPIEEEEWYFGEISRDEAEKMLMYDGDYLVRYSSGQKGFVISTRCKSATKHFVVKKENGMYMFNKQGFLSIRCLLEHQQMENQPLIGEFYLIRPITRNEGDKWEITEKDLDIMDKIGKGNFGYVYKGYMRSRGQHVAIKMCKSDALADQDEFLREAEILKQYRHPHIVEFIGVSQQAECIYIIMELMGGGDFLTFLRNKAIREKKYTLSNMVLNVAEGMTYLSSKDCVHRDLAARNCLIGDGKSVKISDFGMSRQLNEGEYQMSTANKPLPIKWTAPEALHKGLYTCQSDVWSYGILLWETYSCGSTPYPGMDSKTAIEKIELGFRLPAPSGTPPSIYGLMKQCWEYNPQGRPRFPEIETSLRGITLELRSKNS